MQSQLSGYLEEYEKLKEQRKSAKKDIHKFIVHVLSHRNEFWKYEDGEDLKDDFLENGGFVAIHDLLKTIVDRFALESELQNMDSPQRTELITAFLSNQCRRDTLMHNRVPAVIMGLVGDYIFSKYNAYAIDSRGIYRMVRESKYLKLSEDTLRGKTYSDGNYGVELKDQFDKEATIEQEFSDNDSIFDEFISYKS